MSEAFLKNYRQSPRKVRLIGDVIKGKTVPQALLALSFLPKRAAFPVRKVIQSAAANAQSSLGISTDALYVKDVRIDGGVTLKRTMPRARGSAYMIKKRSSHIKIVLDRLESLPKKKLSRAKARKIKAGIIKVK